MTENKYSWLERELITYGQILQRTSPENTQKVKDTFKYTTKAIIAKIEAEKAEARIEELKNLMEQYGEFGDDTLGKTIELKAVTLYRIKHRIKKLKEEA